MPNTPVWAAATGLPNSRRAVLRSILAGAAVATVPAAGAMAALPAPSEALRVAIAAHRAEQAKVDGMVGPPELHGFDDEDEYEEAFAAACRVAEDALWEVAETPVSSDADFFVKVFYLPDEARRELGGLFSHDDSFGKLTFAVEMHQEQREG
jgi:hypothetical protein